MTNIPPISGPSPGEGGQRPDRIDGSFDPEIQLGLTQSAQSSRQIGQTLASLLRRGPRDVQAHELQSGIQTLYGGAMRLAASTQIRPQEIAELSQKLGQLSYVGFDKPAIGVLGRQIEGILLRVVRDSGPLDHGAAFALAHATYFSERLQSAAAADSGAEQGPRIAPVAQETLELARQLADPAQRAEGQDPRVALLLQGMAGSLHAVAARVEDGPNTIGAVPPIRQLIQTLQDAGTGDGQFATAPLAETGERIAIEVDALTQRLVGYRELMTDVNLSLLSLEADAAALDRAVEGQVVRTRRLLGN